MTNQIMELRHRLNEAAKRAEAAEERIKNESSTNLSLVSALEDLKCWGSNKRGCCFSPTCYEYAPGHDPDCARAQRALEGSAESVLLAKQEIIQEVLNQFRSALSVEAISPLEDDDSWEAEVCRLVGLAIRQGERNVETKYAMLQLAKDGDVEAIISSAINNLQMAHDSLRIKDYRKNKDDLSHAESCGYIAAMREAAERFGGNHMLWPTGEISNFLEGMAEAKEQELDQVKASE